MPSDPHEQDPLTYAIIGAAMEVHRELGPGFLEAVYHEALGLELTARQVPFEAEVELPIQYKEMPLSQRYRADYVCYDSVIVELKALSKLTGKEEAQVLNYLKATGVRVALLINFGEERLIWRRFINSKWDGNRSREE